MTQKRKQDKDIRKAEMPKVLPERRPKGFSRMTFELAEDPTVLGYARSIKELKDARDKGGTLSDKNIFHPMNTEGASVDDVRRMIDEAKLIDRIRGQKELEKEEEVKKPVELGAAKGTSVPKQMEMFEEGGLKDEGGTVDPVSGNDVPPGSTQEEVRDDIPAQLSEGEFVFPADVVRYLGLEFLMKLRQKAKAGLQRMEDMGQMGNADEATIPDDAPFNPSQDDLPFTMEDLDMEDEKEYNEGGVVKAQTGTFVAPGAGTNVMQPQNSYPTPIGPRRTLYTPPKTTPEAAPVGGFMPRFTAQTGQGGQQTSAPTFQTLLGATPGQYDEFRKYVNEAGMVLNIPFKNGEPIYPIPEGYTFVDPEATKTEEVTTKEVTPQTTKIVEQDSDDRQREEEENTKNFGVTNPTVISLGGEIDEKGSVKNSMEFSYNVKPADGVLSTNLPLSLAKSVAGIVTGRSMVADTDIITLTPKGYPEVKIELTGKEFKDIVNVDRDDGKGKRISITNQKVQDFIKDRVKERTDRVDQVRKNEQAKFFDTEQFKQQGQDTFGKGEGDPLGLNFESSYEESDYSPSDSFGGTESTESQLSDAGDSFAGDDPAFQQGGLLKKKKRKVKKMKRGGLASR